MSQDALPHRLQPGAIVDGRYRISQRIGHSGGVATYSAVHLVVGRNVQLDILTRSEDKAKRRFRRGGRLLGLMRHPHIVMLYDMGLFDGHAPYMALEYLEGQTLQQRVEQSGPLPADDVVRIARQLLGTLGYIHDRRIVHRALSATKIHIGPDWTGSEIISVTGFSLSRDLGAPPSSSFSSPDTAALTEFAHVSPEQIMAPEKVDHRTDLYAAAVTLYTLLAGASPFPQTKISELGEAIVHGRFAPLRDRVSVPQTLEAVIHQGLATDPDHRFGSAQAMRHALLETR